MRELPEADGWQYEPKWDGFRGLLENVSGELRLWSRNGRPLLRYFPELAPLGELLPPRSCLDGEIVIERDGVLDFDAMQMRLHPAESRIRRLSAEIPALFVAFDVLVWDGTAVWERPLRERRVALERDAGAFRLSPPTEDRAAALAWLDGFEALGLDGVIAKRLDCPYRPGARDAVVKVKPEKTADCVVVGVRWKSTGDSPRLATLLLGLHADDGTLDYVGSAAVAAARHDEIAALVLPSARERAGAAVLGAEPVGRRRAGGVAAPARSSWSRCATTRCRDDGSATARSSCASDPTRIPPSAPGTSCDRRGRPDSRAWSSCSARRGRAGPARAPGGERPGERAAYRAAISTPRRAETTIRSSSRSTSIACAGSTSSGSSPRTARTNCSMPANQKLPPRQRRHGLHDRPARARRVEAERPRSTVELWRAVEPASRAVQRDALLLEPERGPRDVEPDDRATLEGDGRERRVVDVEGPTSCGGRRPSRSARCRSARGARRASRGRARRAGSPAGAARGRACARRCRTARPRPRAPVA